MNPLWIRFKDKETPAKVYEILSKVLDILKSPTALILNDMQKISTILGGTSPNEYSEEAHNKFLDLFTNSSVKEQTRIVSQAKSLFAKVRFKFW